ncbi:putative membrane protein YphA (DoxX/SURF4 family) [Pedobacter sp. AK017]|uniref:MauE/DoxX family redox-associated membrane protein n=1 Tax=Pedobacter sp. AK017 TaxID=2723073 RepID=UPI00161F3A79|nr:MauE/DoxX family redox-associated membrane protein [Pedobacter sp. AK017]MBB5439618.1 putative membrane protein YphA (DoxX/SURF4 family) [Pedobacter sp. AK017]
MKRLISIVIVEVTVILFIVLFVYSAVSKLSDIANFYTQIGKSPLIQAYAYLLAYTVPLMELVIVMFLLFDKTRTLALYLSFTIMVIFTSYIFFIINFSKDIPCSCGGVLEKMSWSQHLWFNMIFITMAFLAIIIQPIKTLLRNNGEKPKTPNIVGI